MAKWRSHAHGASRDQISGKQDERSRRRRQRLAERSLRIEPFEDRKLMAIDLVAVIPNEGAVIPLGVSPQPTLTVAPREFTIRFNEGITIDASTLGEITLERAGLDGFGNGAVPVNIGFRGLGDNLNDVVIRFSENLPDDEYRLKIGGGLKNTAGDVFNLGNTRNVPFDLNLGPQVVAVVPQPVTRSGGALSQATDTIVVYFNNDDLNTTAATNASSYQLIRTNNTATTLDDSRVNPISVTYDNLTDRATLKFAAGVLETAGTFRLRIGNDDPIPVAPLNIAVGVDPGSTFGSANDLGTLFGGTGFETARLTSSIDPQDDVLLTTGAVLLPEFPGSNDEPGHRQISAESHVGVFGDTTGEIPTNFYNFRDDYGIDPDGNPLHNLITEAQKQRVREIFSIYSQYAGVQFVETADLGITIVTGDLRALNPDIPTGPGGVAGLGGPGMAIMDLAEDWGESEFGGSYFRVAMHEIGHGLGLGHAADLPALTIMDGGGGAGNPTGDSGEPVFPGDGDLVHIRHLYRPDSKDIDTYKFSLAQQGAVSFETIAQRLTTNTTGWLDSVVSVYDAGGKLIGRNDDYFGRDSYLKLQLDAGDYFVIVTASGNTAFDPNVLDSGIGGRSEGDYELRLSFDRSPAVGLTDATGVLLDGDHNGAPGGEYNFWFKTQTSTSSAATNRVLWVDKATTAITRDGTLARPFKEIEIALANAEPGDIVRIVGNSINADGSIDFTNAQSYNIGRDILGNALPDGVKMEVPQGVTVMIDAGAVFKLREANIDAGSSAQGIDRSAGAVQVLGTPTTKAVFTSYYDNLAGGTTDSRLRRGDWGGIVFREDSDLEGQGIFLNYVNHADLRYGGGQVVVNSIRNVYNPIHLVESRATLTFNQVTKSADAAMSADPNSFEETLFADYDGVQVPFAADYDRVGPDVYGNRLTDNSINALFVRIATLANESLQPLTKSARFDDTDVVHVLSENLIIQGDAGGATFDLNTGVLTPRLNARLAVDPGIITKLSGARIEAQLGGQFLAEATAENPAIFTSILDDSYGRGGTFDTTNDAAGSSPSPGDWAGFYFGAGSSASIDHAFIAYAGGAAAIEGGFARFNAVEIQQAKARIANSTFQSNSDGLDSTNRNGRLDNDAATIFVRGAQPAIINNVIRAGAGAAININVNALNAEFNNDPGRSTGKIDLQGDFFQNQGPLVVGNRLGDNELNGMKVRGGTLTTESVWDDTDIAHVLFEEVAVPNYHTYGGLRLKSNPGQSLVVKLSGDSAGFTAGGSPLDINDRIGGTVQVVGQPGAPVVLTALSDGTVGAGLKPDGTPQKDTANDALPLRTQPKGSFKINLNLSAAILANPDAEASIRRAAAVWEALIEDPITVTFDMEFGALGGPAGLASPAVASLSYDTVRNAMIADARGHEQVVSTLPTAADFTATTPTGTTVNKASVLVTRANALALGINPAQLPAGSDAKIQFETALDVPGANLFGTALHEIGHALGFTSSVDGGGTSITATTLDLFRVAPGAGQTAFSTTPRMFDPSQDQVFYDGGKFHPGAIQIYNIDRGDIPLSTGDTTGDGWQASHWKDDANLVMNGRNLGVMDPNGGELSNNDKRALDLIGWDVVSAGYAGAWRSVKLDRFSNDRNVAVVVETEANLPSTADANGTANKAQVLGGLAVNERGGDDNLRLGYEVHGAIAQTYDDRDTPDPADDRLADVDVYSFRAKTGTEVWIDIDRSTHAFDSIVELIDANGSVVARSNDSELELATADLVTFNSPNLTGSFNRVHVMQGSDFGGKDFFTTNPREGGMRVVLPGVTSATNTYYVRVRANSGTLSNTTFGASYGNYQLQVRLRETNENPGSSVEYADIRFATDGVEILGKPENSPLLGESAEAGANETQATAQDLGNLLLSNRNALAVSGFIGEGDTVDWYRFSLDQQAVQRIAGVSDKATFWPTVFDLDYADGMGRVNASLAVFDSGGNLVYWNRSGSNDDDQPRPLAGADTADISRGSFGANDPYIGSVDLQENDGTVYYVAVSSSQNAPQELNQFTQANASNPLFRLEPVAEYIRAFTNRVSESSGQTVTLTPDEFHLGDVVLFVNTAGRLYTVDPLTGAQETFIGDLPETTVDPFVTYADIAMRNDGRLYTLTLGNGNGDLDQNAISGNYREINTGNATQLTSVDDGIVTYEVDQDNPDSLLKYNVGVQFEALAHVNNIQRQVFAVGNITPPGFGVPNSQNLLYLLNGDGTVSNAVFDDNVDDERLPTDALQRGTLFTAPTLLPSAATDTLGDLADQTYNTPGDVLDGLTFTLTDVDGDTLVFELDAGVDIAVSSWGAQLIRDGQTFKMGDGVTSKTFEFDSGPTLVVGNGNQLSDGDTFTIVDNSGGVNAPVTFEFDNDGKINGANNVVINFKAGDPVADVVGAVVKAINDAKFDADATFSSGAPFLGRISLTDDVGFQFGLANTSAQLTIEGAYGLAGVGNVAISFEETNLFDVLGASITNAVTGVLTPIRAGFAEREGSPLTPPAERADRITFFNGIATAADLAGTPAFTLTNDVNGNPSKTGVTGANIPVAFDAGDSSNDLSAAIASAVNNAAVTFPVFDVVAQQRGATIELTNTNNNVVTQAPFTDLGAGPGGLITGMSFVGNTLYAVSDKGGFYTIENPFAFEVNGPGTGARLNYIQTSTDLLGLSLSGLTTGPETVENGRYAGMLFATDKTGNIHAFDTTGKLQPIFMNGATNVATGVDGLKGLTFSTLDYNLWHTTGFRGGDAGHSGGAATTATSFYFGIEDPRLITTVSPQPDAANYINGNAGIFNSYELPGGAHGTLTTSQIDLRGYTAIDQPTLYFSYFYDVETDTTRDTARVFASSDGANWRLLQQIPFRSTGTWRQSRLDLSGLEGQENVQLRFDFSTAGDMHVGENDYTGSILRALPASELSDAQTFVIDGTTFEFDLVNVGVQPGNTAVVINAGMTAEDVAEAIATAMDTVFVAGAGNVDDPANFQSVKVDGSQLHVISHPVTNAGPLSFSAELSGDHPGGGDRFLNRARGQNNAFEGLYLDDFIVGFAGRGEQGLGANGLTGFGADSSASSKDIKVGNYDLEIRRGIEPERWNVNPYLQNPDPIGREIVVPPEPAQFPLPIDIRSRLGSSFTLEVLEGAMIAEGETFRISDGTTTVVFEFSSDLSVGSDVQPDGSVIARTRVAYNSTMTAGEVATAVANAINTRFQTTVPTAFKVRALASGTDGRVELFNAATVGTLGGTSFQKYEDVNGDTAIGDENHFRDQGYTVIANNTIQDSLNHNIVVDSGERDVATQPHPGAIRNLREINAQRLVPGISIYNNLLVAGGDGGILFSGDAATGVLGAVPFGRITNNTIYGEGVGVGIRVDDGASPTITNNIIAATATGVQVANGPGTVLGTNIYQGNVANRQGAAETFNIDLAVGQPLFVDAANRNFYLDEGTKAIDSSRDSLTDRTAMTTVTNPLGIPGSSILAPDFDLLGQLRVDDTTVSAPPIPGQGLNVFKDRGAIDRADFIGSAVAIVGPLDNDAAGLDTDPDLTQLRLFGQKIPSFSFQFNDGTGIGIADTTVTAAQITFLRDGLPVPANELSFSYDTTNDVVRLQATAGIFSDGVYTVEFNNSTTGIRDIADNPLLPNQTDGKTLFTIEVAASALAPWQNPGNYEYANLDVNNSGFVSAIDAGIVYDYIKRNGIGPLPLPAVTPPYLDVNGDGACTPVDLALIIDHLNRRAAGLLSSFESSESNVASMFESSSAVETQDGDVAFGLSVSSNGESASGSLFAASGQSSTSAARTAAIDVAIDDYTTDDTHESIDLFDAGASEENEWDSLFEEVEALLI